MRLIAINRLTALIPIHI